MGLLNWLPVTARNRNRKDFAPAWGPTWRPCPPYRNKTQTADILTRSEFGYDGAIDYKSDDVGKLYCWPARKV